MKLSRVTSLVSDVGKEMLYFFGRLLRGTEEKLLINKNSKMTLQLRKPVNVWVFFKLNSYISYIVHISGPLPVIGPKTNLITIINVNIRYLIVFIESKFLIIKRNLSFLCHPPSLALELLFRRTRHHVTESSVIQDSLTFDTHTSFFWQECRTFPSHADSNFPGCVEASGISYKYNMTPLTMAFRLPLDRCIFESVTSSWRSSTLSSTPCLFSIRFAHQEMKVWNSSTGYGRPLDGSETNLCSYYVELSFFKEGNTVRRRIWPFLPQSSGGAVHFFWSIFAKTKELRENLPANYSLQWKEHHTTASNYRLTVVARRWWWYPCLSVCLFPLPRSLSLVLSQDGGVVWRKRLNQIL